MSNHRYEDRQREQNAEYTSAYEDWVATLSPKKRRQLEEQGLLEAKVDPFHVGKQKDVSDMPIAVRDENGKDEHTSSGKCNEESTWAAMRLLISDLLADNNPALGLDCLALVSGIGFLGESMTSLAKRHCVTRAAVSKRCVQITQLLRMSPSRAMRSLTARESYRKAQKKIYRNHEQFNSK